jgi:hypothetical protein
MTYTGVYVFGDSLVDSGNALKLAQWYGDLTFSDIPEGAPTSELGYYKGRFSDGYNFADLVSNKEIGTVTQPVFPYGYEDPWLGIPIAPFAGTRAATTSISPTEERRSGRATKPSPTSMGRPTRSRMRSTAMPTPTRSI